MVDGQGAHDVGAIFNNCAKGWRITGLYGTAPRRDTVIDEIGEVGLGVIGIGHLNRVANRIFDDDKVPD
jgi:hypothetical protein